MFMHAELLHVSPLVPMFEATGNGERNALDLASFGGPASASGNYQHPNDHECLGQPGKSGGSLVEVVLGF